jgi:capsular polysaccharide biosynthesis protein/MinD-like ATPase involved in chromosome partitioning or flagellar assembly
MSAPEDAQLADYTGVLRRRGWLIVLVAVIGLLGSVGYYKLAHKVYTGSASVFVTATSGTSNQVANSRTTGTVNLDTEAQVVQSVAVAQAAGKLLHSPETPQKLIKRVTVTVPANSQVLTISCEARSAVNAARCAQSFAEAYLNYSSSSTITAVNGQISALQSRINGLESASAKLALEVGSLPTNSPERASASEELNSDRSQLKALNNQVALLITQRANPSAGSIISNATPPQSATSPKALLVVPSGLLIGLLAGMILAYVVDRRDRQIRGPRDLTQLSVPVLISLPRTKPAPQLTIASRRSQTGLAFAGMAHMLTGRLDPGTHVILVSGVFGGHGNSLVAANLAVALSRNQPDVTLICADLENSRIPEMLRLPSSPGLTDLLASHAPPGDAGLRVAVAPRLHVITPGSGAGPDAEDLPQDGMERLLTRLRVSARWIVVEGPPVTSGPDAYTLAYVADTVILVAELPGTRSDDVVEGIEHLEQIGATVLGTALLASPREPPPDRAWASGEEAGLRVLPGDPAKAPSKAGGAEGPARPADAKDAGPADQPAPARVDENATASIHWSKPKESPSGLPRG